MARKLPKPRLRRLNDGTTEFYECEGSGRVHWGPTAEKAYTWWLAQVTPKWWQFWKR